MMNNKIAAIRRSVINVAGQFTDIQVKVREATSNDQFGPSSSLLWEIADLTHGPTALTEILAMVWKRMKDCDKNWRHVYKSLILLDYLMRCGSEEVVQHCLENTSSLEALVVSSGVLNCDLH